MTSRTVTITPTAEKPLTADDVREGDVVTFENGRDRGGPNTSSFAAGVIATGGIITSITREVPEPELPSEVGSIIRWDELHIGAIAELEKADQWLCNWDGDCHTNAEVLERIGNAPRTLLTPRDATRQEVIDWIEAYGRTISSPRILEAAKAARLKFALPTQKAD